MGSLERRARHKEALRKQILDAARELFYTQGFERVSMRGIAEKIEYSPKTLYLHFNDKTEILFHLCEEAFQKLKHKVEALRGTTADPESFIRLGLRAYIDFALENPNDWKIAFLTDIRHYPYRSHEEMPRDSVAYELHETLDRAVADCIERKVFRQMDAQVASHALWVGVHGLALVLVVDPEYRWVDREQLIDATIDILIRGLKN